LHLGKHLARIAVLVLESLQAHLQFESQIIGGIGDSAAPIESYSYSPCERAALLRLQDMYSLRHQQGAGGHLFLVSELG
jgi:hypothetical protein